MFGDVGQQFVVQGLVRGIAVFGGPQNGNVAVHAQHGDQKLLQIRPVVLAVPIGDLERLLGQFIVSMDTDRSGIEMHLARIDTELPDGVLGQSGKDGMGAGGVYLVDHPAKIIIAK